MLVTSLSPEMKSLHREAVVQPIQGIAGYLQEHLGQQITAYVSGLNDVKTVGRWIRAQSSPREVSEFRLREAYQVARLLVEAYGDQTARSWFFGTNALLGKAPAAILRGADNPEESSPVIHAAQAFVAEELAAREAEAEGSQRETTHVVQAGG